MKEWLLYGATGYTARLISKLAVERGLRPILAGRNAAAIEAEARTLGLPFRCFGLGADLDRDNGAGALRGVGAVLHCAGPFSSTAAPMVRACMSAGVHYLDITGEIEVFEAAAALDAKARDAGIMLLPGVGFDAVPSDCLAAHLKRRLPSATHLRLAFHSTGKASRGTATTIAEHMGRGGVIRREGSLKRVPSAWRTLDVDFGRGPKRCVSIPWGDVSTAFKSTGIPNIEVYMAAPARMRAALIASRGFDWLLGAGIVKRAIQSRIRRGAAGPTDHERARARCFLWGEASDLQGRRAISLMRTPDGYTTTALTALACLERVLAGQARIGFQTPATAYGPDLVLSLPGFEREDRSANG